MNLHVALSLLTFSTTKMMSNDLQSSIQERVERFKMLLLIVSRRKRSSDGTEETTKRTKIIIPKNKALQLNELIENHKSVEATIIVH